tara:strand:- start:2088 stop:2684 length:597 start_codon:yes stop_codon:yes gene_type:complete
MNVLIACEESQAITIELRKKGIQAWSCDIQECSGGHPDWHIQGDCIKEAYSGKYSHMIAHPPCTYLAVSGARWLYNKDGSRNRERFQKQKEALEFVRLLMNAPIEKIAIENPISVISSQIRKPDQIINPFQFGHPEQKKTCLWLKGFPLLQETNNVYDYMMTLPKRKRTRIHWLGSNKSKERSKTFKGIAKAISDQWF